MGAPSFYIIDIIDPNGSKVIAMPEGTGTVEGFMILLQEIKKRIQ